MGKGEERDRAGVVFLVGLWLSKPSWIVLNDWMVPWRFCSCRKCWVGWLAVEPV